MLKRGKNDKWNKTKWVCQCNCDDRTVREVSRSLLKSGKSKSCGCYHKDRVRQSRKEYVKGNKFEFVDDYVVGYTSTGKRFYFDKCDYDVVKNHTWGTSKGNRVVATINRKTVSIHRFILNPEEDKVIDHINGNPLDNRRSNLRICTIQENTFNAKVSKNNTSGVTGVWFSKEKNKWYAEGKLNQKKIYLGTYQDFAKAVEARVKYEIDNCGEFRSKRNDDKIIEILKSINSDLIHKL